MIYKSLQRFCEANNFPKDEIDFPKAFFDMTQQEIKSIAPEVWIQWAQQRLHDAQYSLEHGTSPDSIVCVPKHEAKMRIASAKTDIKTLKNALKTNQVHSFLIECASAFQTKLQALRDKES